MRISRVLSALAVFILCLESGPGASSDLPRITGATPMQFVGERICVCGNFPTPEAQQGITLDGKPVGTPEQAGRNVAVIRLPADLPPGTHMIGGQYSAFFPRSDQARVLALKYRASIAKQVLKPGESTTMTVVIEGTTQPVQLALVNTTPAVAVLQGGQSQTVTTSGGTPNQVQRTITGIQPHQFVIQIFLPAATCPCASTGSEPSDVSEEDPADRDAEPVGEEPPAPVPEEPGSPCEVMDVKGAMELSQGAWQDDPFFKQVGDMPKAGNKLKKISDTSYKGELAMVYDRPTLIFGIGDSDFNKIEISGTTTGSKLVTVEVLFTLYEGGRKFPTIHRSKEKFQIYLDGPCGQKTPFNVSLPTEKGLPDGDPFYMPASESYRMEAELVRAGTDVGTVIKIDVSGPVVKTRLPRLYFLPLFLSKDSAPDRQKARSQNLALLAREVIDDFYPLKPDSVDAEVLDPLDLIDKLQKFSVPEVVRDLKRAGKQEEALKLQDQVDQERTNQWRSAVVGDYLASTRKLANEGILLAVLSKKDFYDYAPLGAGGASLSTKLILIDDGANIDTVMHEVIHTRHHEHFLNTWGGEEMLAECGIDYHGYNDGKYAYGIRIFEGLSPIRKRMDRVKSLMADADNPNIQRWINQCSYMHLLEELQTKTDPRVILVRGVIGREGDATAGVFFPFYQIDGDVDLQTGKSEGWNIVLRNATGDELGRYPFEPVWRWEDTAKDRNLIPFSFRIEDRSDVARIDLQGPNGFLAKREYSKHAPEVNVISPKPGTTVKPKEGKVIVQWDGNDADGDSILYSALYSSDEGRHWRHVLFEEPDRSATVRVDSHKDKHLVKIIATDGARSAEILLPFSSD